MDERGLSGTGPSIIEKQNLIGAWRAQHSFLAHPQPPAMIRISRAYNFAGFWETPVQRCICWEVQYIQEQVQALCMHAPGQNVRRYICWLVVVCKMRLSAARSGSFENRQLYQGVAGVSLRSIVPLNWSKNFHIFKISDGNGQNWEFWLILVPRI